MSVINDTNDQIAAVMLRYGTPAQQIEALEYAGAPTLANAVRKEHGMYSKENFKRMNSKHLHALSEAAGEDRDLDLTIERWYCTSSIWDDELDRFPNMAKHYTGSLDAKLPDENIIRVIMGQPDPKLPAQWVAWHLKPDGDLSQGKARTEACARRLAYINSLPTE